MGLLREVHFICPGSRGCENKFNCIWAINKSIVNTTSAEFTGSRCQSLLTLLGRGQLQGKDKCRYFSPEYGIIGKFLLEITVEMW